MERVACVVPCCKHTSRPNGYLEWLCAWHYGLIDRRLKLRRQRVRHRLRRRGELERTPTGFWRVKSVRAAHIEAFLWVRMKRQAIERAAGV